MARLMNSNEPIEHQPHKTFAMPIMRVVRIHIFFQWTLHLENAVRCFPVSWFRVFFS